MFYFSNGSGQHCLHSLDNVVGRDTIDVHQYRTRTAPRDVGDGQAVNFHPSLLGNCTSHSLTKST